MARDGIRDLLLAPGSDISGSRTVAVAARPLSVAYIVDPSSVPIALAAVESACLQWGGFHHFLIPCAPGGQPREPWATILDKQDPDYVIDLVGADQRFEEVQRGRLDRAYLRWERPMAELLLPGAHLSAALRRWRRVEPGGQRGLMLLTPLDDDPWALPFAFRFGHPSTKPVPDGARLAGVHAPFDFAEFFQVVVADPRGLDPDQRFRLVAGCPLFPDDFPGVDPLARTDWRQLPWLTRLGVRAVEPSYRHYGYGGPDPEYEQADEAYLRRVLVVGAPSSVADLCLAWSLRAQRSSRWLFPQWVAPEWLSQPTVQTAIEGARRFAPGGMLEREAANPIHVVSASLDQVALEALVGALPGAFVTHPRHALARFFSREFRLGAPRTSVVNVEDGDVRVLFPDTSELADFAFFDRIGWTMEVDGYAPPRGRWRGFRRNSGSSRYAYQGIAGFRNDAAEASGALMQEGLVSGFRLVEALAQHVGYQAAISDKGRLGLAVLGLVGDQAGLAVLASSRVYALLDDMAMIVPRQAVQDSLRRRFQRAPTDVEVEAERRALQESEMGGGQFDRQHKGWGDLRNALGPGIAQQHAATIIRWLVSRRLLLRGYVVDCPTCIMRRWYPIDRLGEVHRCDGCLTDAPIPVPIDTLAWRYRLNEVVARAVDQGVLPHLLAVRTAMAAWADAFSRDLLGITPGVVFEPIDASGPPAVEVDVFAFKAGRAIVGECKRNGAQLSIDEVERFAGLAERLDCSRVIYAAPNGFLPIPEVITRARESTAAVVELWGRDELLDLRLDWRAPDATDPVAFVGFVADVLERPDHP